MGRQDEAGKSKSPQQSTGVVVNLATFRHRADQHDIGAEPFNFPLDVVHGTKGENLPAVHPNQVCEGPAFDAQVSQTERGLRARRKQRWRQRRVWIPSQKGRTPKNAVQAGNDLYRQTLEFVVFPTAHHDELVSRDAGRSRVVVGALGSNDRRARLSRNVRHVETVVEMRVRHQNEIRPLNVRVDHSGVRLRQVIPRQ